MQRLQNPFLVAHTSQRQPSAGSWFWQGTLDSSVYRYEDLKLGTVGSEERCGALQIGSALNKLLQEHELLDVSFENSFQFLRILLRLIRSAIILLQPSLP
ncbi:hypothetical protein Bca52824_019557 [Brassica carinata]|uniref:Uncharacterized protein n=1 Tax=Brassica carinata TaxID=52824 RepID=A0A8X8AYP7_BRACI|nr:hypothetical protein Bca52824_019557 [Brassica carinata]